MPFRLLLYESAVWQAQRAMGVLDSRIRQTLDSYQVSEYKDFPAPPTASLCHGTYCYTVLSLSAGHFFRPHWALWEQVGHCSQFLAEYLEHSNLSICIYWVSNTGSIINLLCSDLWLETVFLILENLFKMYGIGIWGNTWENVNISAHIGHHS